LGQCWKVSLTHCLRATKGAQQSKISVHGFRDINKSGNGKITIGVKKKEQINKHQ